MDRETIIRELYAARLIAENGSQKAEGKIGHLGCVAIKQYLDHAINFLNNKPSEADGWIPVTERIPADGSDILVYCDDGEESRIVACNYDNGVWFDCVFNTVMVFKNITHWMPLPKPPKKEGEVE